ncbi:hypothetical protein SAMN02745116_00686 [Pilibacter termitis]|uniref:Uncharacterized protein n=1 Tax=Pilibacter termitis TaxID=263852 RepID=A0A1T4LJK5_9ENTE|nr:hypothetical protein [Pilibacter termitis]SJZ54811.1 hypothetical protein SAMN02745116_00686 [Pilibacter termitis]
MREQHQNVHLNRIIWIAGIAIVALLVLVPTFLLLQSNKGTLGKDNNNATALQLTTNTSNSLVSGTGWLIQVSEKLANDITLNDARDLLSQAMKKAEEILSQTKLKDDLRKSLTEKLTLLQNEWDKMDFQKTQQSTDELSKVITEAMAFLKENEEREKLFETTRKLIEEANPLIANEFIRVEDKVKLTSMVTDANNMIQKNELKPTEVEKSNTELSKLVTLVKEYITQKEKEKKESDTKQTLLIQTQSLIADAKRLGQNNELTDDEIKKLTETLNNAERIAREANAKNEDIEKFNKEFSQLLDQIKASVAKREKEKQTTTSSSTTNSTPR